MVQLLHSPRLSRSRGNVNSWVASTSRHLVVGKSPERSGSRITLCGLGYTHSAAEHANLAESRTDLRTAQGTPPQRNRSRITDRPPHRAGYASPAKSKPNHLCIELRQKPRMKPRWQTFRAPWFWMP